MSAEGAQDAATLTVGFPIYNGSTLLDFAGATQVPPFHSGDPAEAPPEITASVLAGQKQFIAAIRKATLAVIGGH